MVPPMISAAAALLISAMESGLDASTQPFMPGQYQIGDPAIQQICFESDGSWYGTTFNFGGRWQKNSGSASNAEVFGNYRVEGHRKSGYANDSITIGLLKKQTRPIQADWYDWFDDRSYVNVLSGVAVIFVKSDCDPPFKGENTHAATQ